MITCIQLKRQKCANITVQSNVRSFFPWRASVPVSSVSTSSDSTYLVSEDLSNTSPNTSTTLTSTVPTNTLTSISLNTFYSVASVDYSTSVTNASSHLSCHFPDCHWYSATGQHLEPSSTCGSLFNSSISPSIIHHRRITFGSYLTWLHLLYHIQLCTTTSFQSFYWPACFYKLNHLKKTYYFTS